MRRCRKCNKEWPDTTNVCPDDGFSLTMEVEATVAPVTGSGGPISAGISAAMAAIQQPEPEPVEEFQMGTDLVPGFIVGEYKVDKKIGEGGMGAVYSATHPMIGKRAAIKVISSALGNDASAVGRFVQEARSVNQIGHPNIVDVFAFGELPDGRNYFVMEYLQGESLADRINKAAMPLGEAIEILDQVADGLEAAHEKQIVHRDLKPDNVYLAAVRGGRTMVKLLDFGIAKLSTPDGSGSGGGIQKTRTGMMMGTPGYISPEQARGKNVDYRTDIYALGCMVFEIACGRLPFVADNAMDIVLMHMTQEAERPSTIWPEIPPPLDEIIWRMLQKEPSARPSLQEVRAVFSELVTSGLVTLTAGKGVAFGSGMRSNLNTPRPQTGVQAAVAVGTSPGAVPPSTQTGPVPIQAPPPAKKTGLIAAIIGGVLVVGGVGGFLAMKGGKEPQKVAETTPAPVPEAPKPEAPKPEAPKPEVVKPEVTVKQPGTIVIAINVESATVSVDGNPVTVTGKTATAKVDLEGEHLVSVTADGREPYETTVKTKSGDSVSVVAMLEKAKAKKPGGSGTKTTKTTTATAGTKTTPTGTTPTTTTTTTTTTATPVDKNATVDPFAN